MSGLLAPRDAPCPILAHTTRIYDFDLPPLTHPTLILPPLLSLLRFPFALIPGLILRLAVHQPPCSAVADDKYGVPNPAFQKSELLAFGPAEGGRQVDGRGREVPEDRDVASQGCKWEDMGRVRDEGQGLVVEGCEGLRRGREGFLFCFGFWGWGGEVGVGGTEV